MPISRVVINIAVDFRFTVKSYTALSNVSFVKAD